MDNPVKRDDDPLADNVPGIKAGYISRSDQMYWRLFRHGMQFAIAVHAAFIFLFYFLGAHLLAAVNIFSVLLYVLCLHLLNRQKKQLVIPLCWFEVTGHALLAVYSFGWDSGFHYYMFLFIPLIFASATRKLAAIMLMTLFITFIYIAMDLFMHTTDPLITVQPLTLDVLRYSNILVCFVFLGYVTFMYIQMVREAESSLALIATTDPLTGLYNRRYLLELVDYEIRQHKRTMKPLAFIILDIDDFKYINDKYGHLAGDEALRVSSKILQSELREKDSIARWGGEEFLILLPETDLDSARDIAERLRKMISAIRIFYTGTSEQSGRYDFGITMTFGVTAYLENEEIDRCIARADKALYHGKQNGKNRVEIFQ